ncbi:DNA repair and recombination protein RadB [Halalkaliarchaeum desulfuricum]|uniref:DNA repair and recombination protein RadB n=1 Tax=Halalkaliarchaeum desulfuricum TaxID=2055893 RepID=A0A343TP02_9EURY|nr:DNA repair and recombination protein RadB [Halalkaliarchaeum desulfuricum]AUX10824.1 DNA repair and recombination protein RadB [Halalkaliarchaeum desulfuricum]
MSDPLPVGCSAIDDLLGGGLERGTVTQVYGPPAAGKTNLVLSASVEVAAEGGRVCYVDTEGLSVDRFHQLLEARIDRPHVEESLEEVAGRLVISDAYDFEQQKQAVRDAEDLAPDLELIVLDSATGFYRLERTLEADEDAGESLRAVARQVTHLLSLARKHDLAVVITNQVFTDPDSDRAKPLGGHTLDHWTGVILRLDRFRGGNRRATLEKHRSMAAGESTTFKITGTGLSDGDGI